MTLDIMIIYGLLIHYLGDFALQTHWQATNKSTNVEALSKHVGVYSLVWFIALIPILGVIGSLFFTIITFMAHWLTDYATSPFTGKAFREQDYHNAFAIIGFDQILHYIQLYYTFKLLL